MIQLVDTDKALFRSSLEFAKKQVRGLIEKHPDFYPMYTKDGLWKHEGPAWTHWCDGFLPGMMWVFRKHSSEAEENTGWIRRSVTPSH